MCQILTEKGGSWPEHSTGKSKGPQEPRAMGDNRQRSPSTVSSHLIQPRRQKRQYFNQARASINQQINCIWVMRGSYIHFTVHLKLQQLSSLFLSSYVVIKSDDSRKRKTKEKKPLVRQNSEFPRLHVSDSFFKCLTASGPQKMMTFKIFLAKNKG